MSAIQSNQIFYPQVSQVPKKPDSSGVSTVDQGKNPDEFRELLQKTMETESIQEPIKFSGHATQRLQERKILLDEKLMEKVQEGFSKADAKGIEDSLILTDQAAFIVNVKNRTVVTAMDRNQLSGNVFTKIDGAVIV